MNDMCNDTIFFFFFFFFFLGGGGPPPEALGGAKKSNIIKFQLQSQFQRFLNQTLCVFSQMKGIKHITVVLLASPNGTQFFVFKILYEGFFTLKNCMRIDIAKP